MIDLHSHILPGIDDGADTLETALEMARIAVAEGTEILACTPHIVRGVYDNSSSNIMPAIAELQRALDDNGIDLRLISGADVHVRADLLKLLQSKEIPTLDGSNYFLFEPPHHVCPPNIAALAGMLLSAGYVPVLTHPERLSWIERDYKIITDLDDMGVAMQITAQSLTGGFGSGVERWALRMLDEGRIDIIASDAHSPKHRPPGLQKAHALITKSIGAEAADQMVLHNPRRMLNSEPLPPKERPKPITPPEPPKKGLISRLFGG